MATYPVYLDFNATTPINPAVIEEIHKSLQNAWGNPSSNHSLGLKARAVIEESRNSIAQMINGSPEDVVFTSGGTEANNVAIISAIKSATKTLKSNGRPHVITSNVEHDSVIKVLLEQEQIGNIDLSVIEVNKSSGCLEVESVISQINERTCLITIMHANNETGLIMPIEKIGLRLKDLNKERSSESIPRILFHTDAAQTLGKVKVDVEKLGVDYLTIVGHKFYAPRIGAIYARKLSDQTPIFPLVQGGGQEKGYRPGTENTSMIAGLGHAAKLVGDNLDSYKEHMQKCRDYLSEKLQVKIANLSINFTEGERLPNTLSIRLPMETLAVKVLENCSGKVFASLGAACHSHTGQPSGVLISSGLSMEEAQRTIRLSVGRETSFEEIDLAVTALSDAC